MKLDWHSINTPRLVTVFAVLLLIGSFSIILPLSKRDQQLTAELNDKWRTLWSKDVRQVDFKNLDIARIRRHLEQLYDSDLQLALETPLIRSRIQIDPAVQKRMKEPFQLIDYINEFQLKIEEIENLAKEKKTKLDQSVLNSFPEHTSDRVNPELLWAELELVYQAVTSALNCGVYEMLSLRVGSNPSGQISLLRGKKLIEIPLRIKLSGPMNSVYLFLQSLPLRADEIARFQLPAAHKEKPALFINNIVILKNSTTNADSVEVEVAIVGLIYHEPVL